MWVSGVVYRVDVVRGELLDDDGGGGDFRWLRPWKAQDAVYYGSQLLDSTDYVKGMAVSPDNQRVLWLARETDTLGGDHHKLRYYDAAEGVVRTVSERCWRQSFVWVSEEDLKPVPQPQLPSAWTPF